MKNLIIIGAGGAGRETLDIALELSNIKSFKVLGFLDDFHKTGSLINDYPILGKISDWEPKKKEVFVCAIGDIEKRKAIIKLFENKNAKFINLIHPTAIISIYAKIGTGNIIFPYVWISANTIIGDYVFINSRVSIGHDAQIGNFCVISSFCDVTGYVVLEDSVFLGSHVSIAPKIKICQYSFIAIGSIVLKNTSKGSRVIGYPAKKYN
jgi:sugar O-acyltransferase (sialic acid O-acetyltransferase NeuD family)